MENFTLRVSHLFTAFLLFCLGLHSQPTEYAEYSYTEFFDLISEEKDSVFRMSDALISYNDATDADFRMNVIHLDAIRRDETAKTLPNLALHDGFGGRHGNIHIFPIDHINPQTIIIHSQFTLDVALILLQ